MARARDRLIWGAAAAAAVALIAYVWTHRGAFAPLDADTSAPAYSAVTLDGDTVDLAQLRGRVVLLNVWATWCTPCVREMPALQRLYERHEADGLSVVAVSVDGSTPGLGAANVSEFVNDLDVTFTILLDPSGSIEETFRVRGLPTTFVIDREGRIREKVLGAREWDEPPHASDIRSLLDD